MKKKIIFVLISVLVIVGAFTIGYQMNNHSSIGIIGGADGPTSIIVGEQKDNSLYQKGLDVVALMDEMVKNEDYVKLYTANTAISEIVNSLSEMDYQSPKNVYKLNIAAESILSAMMDMSGGMLSEGMSDELSRAVEQKVIGTVTTQIIAMSGAENLAASTVCTANQLFINHTMTEDVIYIYMYENAVPVAVTFIRGDEGIVSATGHFLLNEEMKSDSEESITQFFEELGAKLVPVEN